MFSPEFSLPSSFEGETNTVKKGSFISSAEIDALSVSPHLTKLYSR